MPFIKKQLDKVSPLEWIGIGASVLGAAAVYWAAITDWFSTPWAPLAIPMVLVIIATVYSIVDRFSQRRARAPFKPLEPNPLRDMIQQWLTEYQFTVSYPPDSPEFKATNYAWVMNAVKQLPASFQVAYSPTESMLTLSAYYNVPEQWWPDFDKLTSDPKLALLDEIVIELAHFELTSDGFGHPLRHITLTDQMLYDESFSKIRFAEKAQTLLSAQKAAEAIIRRAGSRFLILDEPTTEPDDPKSDEEHGQSHEELPDK